MKRRGKSSIPPGPEPGGLNSKDIEVKMANIKIQVFSNSLVSL